MFKIGLGIAAFGFTLGAAAMTIGDTRFWEGPTFDFGTE